METLPRYVDKGWGHELIFADTPEYCGKLLCFHKAGATFSMHYHTSKKESWYVQKGSFHLRMINTLNASIDYTLLEVGATWTNLPNQPHQLVALEDDSVIVEVSTADSVSDNHRVMPGDSQK